MLHTNSLDYFVSSNNIKILTSNRNSNELIIIDWNTGYIEERIAGRNASMNFIPSLYSGDKLDLYGQHAAKILSWNEGTQKLLVRVFNNKYNQAKAEAWVLELDFNTNTIHKNVEIVSSPALLSTHLGNIDNYSGENWLINWGRTYAGRKNATGYSRFGVKQFNLFLPDSVDSYRITPVEQDEMDALYEKRPTITQNGCTLIASSKGYWSDGTTFGTEFTLNDTGTYFIEAAHGIGWISSEKIRIESLDNECGTVGIFRLEKEKISVYPNPSTGIIYTQNIDEGEHIRVVDMLGKEVFSNTISKSSAEIDLSNSAPGIYILRTNNGYSTKIFKR